MNQEPILIVDDEKNIRVTLEQSLETLDIKTETAVNGEEALKQLEKKSYSLILLDLKMPGIGGMKVLHHISEHNPDIRVIIITAHGTIESAVEAMKLGAVDFIQKPFTPVEIRELVTKVLNRSSIEEDKAEGYTDYIELAKKYIQKRAFDTAKEYVKKAIILDESKPEAHNLLGALLELNGDWLDGLKHYRAALALDPTYSPANQNVDRIVSRQERGKGINLGEENDSSQADR